MKRCSPNVLFYTFYELVKKAHCRFVSLLQTQAYSFRTARMQTADQSYVFEKN